MFLRIVIPLLLFSTLAWAQVCDDAVLFSTRAVEEAEGIIHQIHQQAHRALLVETFAGIGRPSSSARERLETLHLDGVCIWIVLDPLRLEIAVSPDTRQRAFTLEDAADLRTLMLNSLRKSQFDQALLAGTHFVHQTMLRNLPEARRP